VESKKPILMTIREEDGVERGVEVFGDATKEEVRAFFKRVLARHPADTASFVGERDGMSESEIEDLRGHIENGVRTTTRLFDPERADS